MSRLILTKSTFYELSAMGLCGNTPRVWNNVKEYWPERKRCPEVSLRRLDIANRTLASNIPYRELRSWIASNGVREGTFILNEVPKGNEGDDRLIQGELGWANGRWVFYYTHVGGFMREKLARFGREVYGWDAIRLIRNYCTPSDYEDLMDLFDFYTVEGRYPVIEFSVVSNPVGIIPGRNTLIWEIRHY